MQRLAGNLQRHLLRLLLVPTAVWLVHSLRRPHAGTGLAMVLRERRGQVGHRSERHRSDRESDQPAGGGVAVAVGAGAASGCGKCCNG